MVNSEIFLTSGELDLNKSSVKERLNILVCEIRAVMVNSEIFWTSGVFDLDVSLW